MSKDKMIELQSYLEDLKLRLGNSAQPRIDCEFTYEELTCLTDMLADTITDITED